MRPPRRPYKVPARVPGVWRPAAAGWTHGPRHSHSLQPARQKRLASEADITGVSWASTHVQRDSGLQFTGSSSKPRSAPLIALAIPARGDPIHRQTVLS